LICRLAADGVPKARIAARLGISRATVVKAVASEGPPKYVRSVAPTSFSPFEAKVFAAWFARRGRGARSFHATGWVDHRRAVRVTSGSLASTDEPASARRTIYGVVHSIGANLQ
jgi:hypothetical protein